MRRILVSRSAALHLAATLSAAAAGVGSAPTPAGSRPARRILLDGAHSGAIRFLAGAVATPEGDSPTSWVTVTRTGNFRDPRYGEFEISRPMLSAMVENFNKRVYGQDIFIDVAHEPSGGAAGKIVELAVDGSKLRARVEWTPYGVDAIRNRGFIYLSAEYHENWQDNESLAKHGPVLLGAGLVIRPCIKKLDPIQLAEDWTGDVPTLMHPDLSTKLLQELNMKWAELIKALKEKLTATKLADMVVAQLVATAEKTLGSVTDEATAKALITSFEATGLKLAEQIGSQVVTLSIEMPKSAAGLTEEQVRQLLEANERERAEAARKLAEQSTANVKLLSDTIGAAEGLDDALKKELTDAVRDLVTPDLTEEQVKKLAAAQIASGNRIAAASKLAQLGFQRAGTPHITVDDSNSVKALQEAIDKRVGLAGLPDHRRYARTGGALPPENREFAEKVLAEYDAANARQLRAEHKMLAAGDGLVSDVSVPSIFERTVIREALYGLIGLQFVDTGTLPFASSALIPYSYRDSTAASRSSTRKYEGQAIARAGVKQTSDTAYPIPQKLAFEVSDELRYLTSNGQLDWDAVAENVRNASRIVGEDTEKLIFDEVLDASDQYATATRTDEAIATADGTKTIFCTDYFPVVRPKKVYDLQGNQVGSTLYALTVKTNSVARSEYDGTGTQSAGLYYSMNYNTGEISFVTELGAASAPTNGHAVTASYTYSTNVKTWDTDLGADNVEDKYQDLLYYYGLRKDVIENDRYHMANFGLMSGSVRTAMEQAKSFMANFSKPGTNLQTDGNLGVIKGVPNYRTTAPGLVMADSRILVGERGMTRFRMMKPWAMNQLENQKDSNGRFTGKKEAYGDQFIVLHTPTPLKAAYTSIVLYSATARVDR